MNFMGTSTIGIDLLTIIIAFLFLFYGPIATASFAVGQGLLIDLFSGGLHGLFTSLYLMTYGCVFLGHLFFSLHQPKGQMIIISLTVLAKELVFLLMITIFYSHSIFSPNFLWRSLLSALVAGLIAPVVFYLFTSLRANAMEEARTLSTDGLDAFRD